LWDTSGNKEVLWPIGENVELDIPVLLTSLFRDFRGQSFGLGSIIGMQGGGKLLMQ
jgi:hypothetical protein